MNIFVAHDIVCPWCRIGKAYLADALAAWTGEPVQIVLHPYFLNASTPDEGMDFRTYLRRIKGDDDIQPLLDRVSEVGARRGLVFNWDRVQRYPKTLLAHTMLLAAPEEQRSALLDAIYTAYFERGEDIGNREVLLGIALGLGLDPVVLAQTMDDPDSRTQVAQLADALRRQGVTSVPFFLVDGKVALSGAQAPAAITRAMQQALSARAGA
jgi:predicted DsbA family dithiol-disulfide isomerase